MIRRIAVRLRDCPADRLQRLSRQKMPPAGSNVAADSKRAAAGRLPSPAEANSRRGSLIALQGSLVSVELVEDRGGEPLWRCIVRLSEPPQRVVVYVAEPPGNRLSGSPGQGVALDGVFVKYVPGIAADLMAVVVAPRLQSRWDSPLGKLGMDCGLMEEIHDGSALTAADHEAFYRLLLLAKNADPAALSREADCLDTSTQGLAELFRDPAGERGRLVKLSGTARRVVRVPIEEPSVVSRLGADHYFEIDLVAEQSQGNPLVFCTLSLPDGMPLSGSPSYSQSIQVTGFFLKTWQYPTALSDEEKAAQPGSSRALQTAPLVIGGSPLWKPVAVGKKSAPAAAFGGFLALAMIGVCLLLWHFRQSDQEFSRQVFARE